MDRIYINLHFHLQQRDLIDEARMGCPRLLAARDCSICYCSLYANIVVCSVEFFLNMVGKWG